MSFTTPPLNTRVSAKQATQARTGSRPVGRQYVITDAIELAGHTGALFQWYRESFLRSQLGDILARSLEDRTDQVSKVIRTGDLENLVKYR